MNQHIVRQLLELIEALSELAAAYHPDTQALRRFEDLQFVIQNDIEMEMERIEEDNK